MEKSKKTQRAKKLAQIYKRGEGCKIWIDFLKITSEQFDRLVEILQDIEDLEVETVEEIKKGRSILWK